MQALLSAPGGASAARCAAPRRQGCSAALFAAPPQCPPSPACARKLVRARGSCGPLRSAGLTGRASAARRARTAPRASSDVAEGNGAADGASLIAPTPPPPDSLRSPPAPAVQRNSSGGVSLPGTPTGWGAAAAAAAPRSFRKAEMYLVRTDGFTCTRETVKGALQRRSGAPAAACTAQGGTGLRAALCAHASPPARQTPRCASDTRPRSSRC